MGEPDENAAQQLNPAPVVTVPTPSPEPPKAQSAPSIWDRIKRHKVVEWTVAYIAFGYATLHGAEMLRDAFEWSPAVPRLTFFALALGLPIAVTLAWFHGHRAQHRISRAELATLVTLLLVAGSALWFLARTERARVASSAVATSIPFAKPLGDKSIAVLPFVDMSEKKDQEYFSDGLSEELIDLLAQTRDLQVIARTSSFYFKGKQVTIADIAKTLGAANILEGSVRKAGNTIRVTAQLIRADTGLHLWSESYDRDVSEIFKVQDEVAMAVVGALKLKLAPSRQSEDTERSENPEAYDQYLLGKQLNHRGKLEDFRRAVAADLKAVALDPGYAAAYAALAFNESHAATQTGDAGGFDRARRAAEKAISLAPQLAAGYRARAVAQLFTLDFPGAQADEQKALTLASGDSRVQNDYGYLLATFGRLPDAIATMNRAIVLDPLNSDAWGNLGSYLTAQRNFPAARRALQRALAISPDDVETHFGLGSLNLLDGQLDAALAEFTKSDDANRLQGEAILAHTRGDNKKSQQELEQLITKYASASAYQVAAVYAWRGEKDKAFQWLQRAYRQRDAGLAMITYDPFLTRIRADPRFGVALQQLKLSD